LFIIIFKITLLFECSYAGKYDIKYKNITLYLNNAFDLLNYKKEIIDDE